MSASAPARPDVASADSSLSAALAALQAAMRGASGQMVGPRSRVIEGTYNGQAGCFLLQRFDGSWRTIQAISPTGALLIGGGGNDVGQGALPTASATYERRFWYVPGGTGAPSMLYFCSANTSGGYEWGPVFQST